jgi:predicted proteasome-type protease
MANCVGVLTRHGLVVAAASRPDARVEQIARPLRKLVPFAAG